jgi:type I restriction enzyme, S subunit
LAAAFRGQLTNKWRERATTDVLTLQHVRNEHARLWSHSENRTKRGKYAAPSNNPEANGIDGWLNVRVEWIAYVVDPHPSHRTPPQTGAGVPYIGQGDVDHTGSIDFANARKVSSNVLVEHKQRYVLHDGDFAFGKIGTLGEPFLLPWQQDYTLSANVILIQPRASFLNPTYLFYYFTTSEVLDVVTQGANATSQAAFGIKKLREIAVPVCSYEEQSEIVRLVEIAFAWIDRLASETTSARKLIDHLDQAILAKAFRGELVLQDPNDEPASVLLEQIKAERNANGLSKRTVRRMPRN